MRRGPRKGRSRIRAGEYRQRSLFGQQLVWVRHDGQARDTGDVGLNWARMGSRHVLLGNEVLMRSLPSAPREP